MLLCLLNSHMDVWMDDRLLIFHPAEESEWHQPSVTNYRHLCLHTQPQRGSQLSGDRTSISLNHMSITVSVHPVTIFIMQLPHTIGDTLALLLRGPSTNIALLIIKICQRTCQKESEM